MNDITHWMMIVEDAEFVAILEKQFPRSIIGVLLGNVAKITGDSKDDVIKAWKKDGRPTDHQDIMLFLKGYGLSRGDIFKAFKKSDLLGKEEVSSSDDLSMKQRVGKLWGGVKSSLNQLRPSVQKDMLSNPRSHKGIDRILKLVRHNDMEKDIIKYLKSTLNIRESINESLTNQQISAILKAVAAKGIDHTEKTTAQESEVQESITSRGNRLKKE